MRFARVGDTKFLLLVVSGRKQSLIVQGIRNLLGTYPFRPHFEDAQNRTCRRLVTNRQSVLIIALYVAVRGNACTIFACLGIGFNDRADLL